MMLTQLKLMTESKADTVVAQTPTLRSLFEAYEKEPDPRRRDELLKDGMVAYKVTGERSNKILNVGMSSKIHTVFWNEDSLTAIS